MHFEDLEVNKCTVNSSELAAHECEHLDQTRALTIAVRAPCVATRLEKRQKLFRQVVDIINDGIDTFMKCCVDVQEGVPMNKRVINYIWSMRLNNTFIVMHHVQANHEDQNVRHTNHDGQPAGSV